MREFSSSLTMAMLLKLHGVNRRVHSLILYTAILSAKTCLLSLAREEELALFKLGYKLLKEHPKIAILNSLAICGARHQ